MPDNFDFIQKIGGTSSGTGELTFNAPHGLTTDGRFLWVCDTNNNRIKKLKLSGLSFVAHYGDINVSTGLPTSGSGNTGFNKPEDIVYSADHGLLFVSDLSNNRIKLHRAHDMAYVNEITGLSSPRGLAVNRQYLWCSDGGNSRIVRIKLSDLSIEQATGTNGSGNQQLETGARQIAYDPHERVIYIADLSNLRVLKWDAFGLMTFRDKITGLSSPYGLAYKDHILYVGDIAAASPIAAYAAATLALQEGAGTSGTGSGNTVVNTVGHILAYHNVIFFTDSGSHRLMCWQSYRSERALTADSSQVIPGGGWFDSPISEIGDSTTAIGADLIDRQRWVKSTDSGDSVAWVKT